MKDQWELLASAREDYETEVRSIKARTPVRKIMHQISDSWKAQDKRSTVYETYLILRMAKDDHLRDADYFIGELPSLFPSLTLLRTAESSSYIEYFFTTWYSYIGSYGREIEIKFTVDLHFGDSDHCKLVEHGEYIVPTPYRATKLICNGEETGKEAPSV